MAGATSLVQLILKKWGDDIAGAAKELEKKVGFPESVANRIATGELPMDAESVARRADEQGYGDVVYRGINGEYDPDKAGYYQMFTTSEQDAAEYGGNVLEARLNLGDNAVVDGGGRNFNSIPTEDGLLVRTDELAHAAREAGRDSLTIRNIHDKADNEIPRRPSVSNTGPSDEEIMRELGLDYSPPPNASPAPDARNYDPVDVDVVFDPSRIRSPNAAFDPQYTGSNIMGGAALPVAAGLLAAGQSDDADAGISAPLKLAKKLADLDPKIDAHISERPTGLILDKLVVPEEARGQGIGGELMERLASYADEEGKRVALTAAGDFGGSRAGQERFYRRYGFVPNKGRNKDFEFTENMVRAPSERGNADPRLLAGIAGTTAAGLAAPMVKDSGMISAPRSETLFDLTMGARDIERRLEGSLASLLFPSGLVDYLETVNRREEDPNAMTRGMALLDVLPF